MKSNARWIIVLGHENWKTVRCHGSAIQSSSPETFNRNDLKDDAERVAKTLIEQGYGGEPVLLALESNKCLCANVTLPTPRHARNRSAMTYLVEPYLPWSAEESVIDYELHGSQAFVAATETQSLADFIEALEKCDVRVESITPLARLALTAYITMRTHHPSRCAVVWGDADSIELWLLEGTHPIGWQRLPHQGTSAIRAISQLALGSVEQIVVVGINLAPNVREALAQCGEIDFQDAAALEIDSLFECGMREAAAVLDGVRAPALQFRRDTLAMRDRHRSLRRHLQFVQVAVLFLLAALGAGFLLKSAQYDAARKVIADQQVEVYRAVFPGRREQVGVRSALDGELARLKGLRGGRAGVPEAVESAMVLERLLKSLPKDFRLRILEVRIERGNLYLVGHVRDHTDADRIAAALRHAKLRVESPSTHRLAEQGVEFRISARIVDEKSDKKGTST